jgi:hypothetical protein
MENLRRPKPSPVVAANDEKASSKQVSRRKSSVTKPAATVTQPVRPVAEPEAASVVEPTPARVSSFHKRASKSSC